MTSVSVANERAKPRWIGELQDRHPGEDLYVVGTGPSLRVFPLGFLEGKITIGLNQAWKLLPVTYNITSVPEFNMPQFLEDEETPHDTIWITKFSKFPRSDAANLSRTYFFESCEPGFRPLAGLDEVENLGRNVQWVLKPHPRNLYLWTSMSQTAVNLAANMGAKNIVLIGCDNAALGRDHHAHDQHTMWRGNSPEEVYRSYYEGLREIRTALRARGVAVLSAGPFLKLDAPELDFRFLCDELGKQAAIPSHDVPRGYNLADENRRYRQLTRYILRKNLRRLLGRSPAAR